MYHHQLHGARPAGYGSDRQGIVPQGGLAHRGNRALHQESSAAHYFAPEWGVDVCLRCGRGPLAHLDTERKGEGCFLPRSCSGGYILNNGGNTLSLKYDTCECGTIPQEAELNTASKRIAEGMGVTNAITGPFGENRSTGVGKVKHPSTKQLWVQEDRQRCCVEVHRLRRAENSSGMLTHPLWESELKQGLRWMEYHTPGECLGRT